jgi:Holliday junction resolvase RusA-like endonuclease
VREIQFDVAGLPVPQGSKRLVNRNTTYAHIIDDNDKTLVPWRAAVTHEANLATALSGGIFSKKTAIRLVITFVLPRPASAPKRRFPITRPDLDKLTRAVKDSLTKVAYYDDSQVVELHCIKRFPRGEPWYGAHIAVVERVDA